MLDTTRGDARALLSAVVTGSAVGLVVAGAFLMGGPVQASQAAAEPVPVAADPVAAPAVIETVNRQGARSGEILNASLTGPAARPFTSHAKSDLDCLTEAVYYEARGEGPAGQAAVAQVVLNRVRHPSFPKSVCAVVYQGCQFSFACNGSRRARREVGAWNRARGVAASALAGAVASNVGNATHFHTVHVTPHWGPNLLRVGQVGLHVFYRFGGKTGRPDAFSQEPETDAPPVEAMPYRRLTPEERVYMTSLTLAKAGDLAIQPSVPAPVAPAAEATSAPAAKPASTQAPAAKTVATIKTPSAPSVVAAS